MTKILIVITLLFLGACSTKPESLRLTNVKAELVDYTKYHSNWRGNINALAVSFEGRAPFAAIVNAGRQPQFRCYLVDSANNPISDVDFGSIFFEGSLFETNKVTNRIELDHDEQYKYKAIVFRDLKGKSKVNGPADLDLLNARYSQVQCQLVGVMMFGGFMYSNEIYFTKDEIRTLYSTKIDVQQQK